MVSGNKPKYLQEKKTECGDQLLSIVDHSIMAFKICFTDTLQANFSLMRWEDNIDTSSLTPCNFHIM